MNGDNLNNVRHKTSRAFMNKRKYLRDEFYKIEAKSKIKILRDLYRGIWI
jgi:hypothetical protein